MAVLGAPSPGMAAPLLLARGPGAETEPASWKEGKLKALEKKGTSQLITCLVSGPPATAPAGAAGTLKKAVGSSWGHERINRSPPTRGGLGLIQGNLRQYLKTVNSEEGVGKSEKNQEHTAPSPREPGEPGGLGRAR